MKTQITMVSFTDLILVGREVEPKDKLVQGQDFDGCDVQLTFDEDPRFLRVDMWPRSQEGKLHDEKNGHFFQLVPLTMCTIHFREPYAQSTSSADGD